MQVISLRTLRQFWQDYPYAKTPLLTWYKVVAAAQWTGPADVKATFGTADVVGDKRVMIWDIAKGGGNAMVDPSDLETIVRELVANAGEATFHGGKITIRVRDEELTPQHSGLSPSPQPGEYSVLEVSDTGRGFAQGTLPYVLEPFYTDKAPDQGRGLGLSVVHAIAARYGGGLLIETMPGSGSRVRVYLPMEQAAAA